MMIDRKDKRYVSCPVCGRILMKCQGQCNIDITCGKCNREIVVLVDEERVMVLENRRGSEKDGKAGQVRVSVQKSKEQGKSSSKLTCSVTKKRMTDTQLYYSKKAAASSYFGKLRVNT